MSARKLRELIGFMLMLILAGPTPASERYEVGDVLLIGLGCYSCRLIEQTTEAPYSHSGVVLSLNGELVVAQALGSVHVVSVAKFLQQRRPGSHVGWLRPAHVSDRALLSQNLALAYQKLAHLPFDSDYLWDDERLYCSEFVAKLFNQALGREVFIPRPIDYGANDDVWRRLMRGNYNGGELGNSPADLWRDPFFEHL